MRPLRHYLIAGLLAPLAATAMATEEIETVVVTGTYSPLPLGNLSSSVTVLDEEFLRLSNKRSVADVLRTVPGLLIEELGGAGGLTAVSIRGGEANFTLVLIDGVQLNDPTNTRGGGFDFSNLDLTSIERIEIVRGPQSAVYGSDALAGAINIITVRSTQEHRQRVKAEWGQHGYSHYAATATGSEGELGYALQVAKRDSGESTRGSMRENDEANLGIDWSPSELHQLQLSYRYLDGKRSSFPEQSGGPRYSASEELDFNRYTDNTLAVGWGWQVLPGWHSRLEASRFDHDDDYSSPGIFPYFAVPPQLTTTRFTRDQFRWVNSLDLGDNINLALGADYRSEEGDSKGEIDFGFASLPTDFSLDRSTRGLFLESYARVLPALVVQGSVRYDDPDNFDAETTLKLGGKYNLTSSLAVLANWGEGFKLPSFFALGHALVGNPNLRPETGQSWDVGLQWSPTATLMLNGSYFSNEYQDLIDFDAELFTNVNRRQVDTSGVELQLNWGVTETVNLLAHATYTDIDVREEAAPLLGRPSWTAGATGLWQISSRWRFSLDYQWTGEQHASSRYTGDTVIETLPDFHQLDTVLAWQFAEWGSVELAIDNMLDADFDTAVGFPGPGRSARVALIVGGN